MARGSKLGKSAARNIGGRRAHSRQAVCRQGGVSELALVRQASSSRQRINLSTLLWTGGDKHIPVDYRLYDNSQDGAIKNDHCRAMLQTAKDRGFSPVCIEFDSWFSSLENLKLNTRPPMTRSCYRYNGFNSPLVGRLKSIIVDSSSVVGWSEAKCTLLVLSAITLVCQPVRFCP